MLPLTLSIFSDPFLLGKKMIKEKTRKNRQYWIDGEVNKIENYDLAIADTTQVWHCHHKLEI